MANQLNFVDYDFDALVVQLTNRLKERGAWKDTYRSSTGSMLIELFAAVANLVLYYVERRAEESYILTAKNKSSIINLVRLLNYIPKRKISAIGVLRFTLTDGAQNEIIFIPKYTLCTANNGKKFLVSEDAAIMPGQTYVDVNAIQGELVSINYSSQGTINQEYKIEDISIENGNLYMYVEGEEWVEVSSFINSTTLSKEYILRPELDDTATIIFGNNVFGKAPSLGDTILMQYIKSDGLDGNVYELDRITTLNDTIYDVNEESVNVTVTNITTFLGGDDAESLEEIRNEAPAVFATGDRAVTKNDFVAILNNYAGVANSNVWGENEETPPNYDMYNQVKICLILQNWILPDAAFKIIISDYLYTKSLMTVRYSFIDPTVINVIPTLDIKVIKGRSLTNVEALITGVLEDEFILGDTTKLGVDKRLSDIVAIVEGVSGVSYSHITLQIRKDLVLNYDSTYDYGEILDCVSIKAGTVELYLNDNKIATDDGANAFTDESSAYTVNGNIDYTTGVIGINISPALGVSDVLYVKYQQDEEGDIIVNQNQICKIYDTDITSISYTS